MDSATTTLLFLAAAALRALPASGHGYLAAPRSRNLLAHEETVWWPQTESDPEPETCPHCLNRGGTRARCGLIDLGAGRSRDYDAPKNALGGPMPTKVQATYRQGEEVTLDVTLTAHHGGHFVFSACPIEPGERPSQECFDEGRLTFVEDLLHGAVPDPKFPERAYLAPVDKPGYTPDMGSDKGVMDFSFKMRLPANVHGDLVLIQWYYLTANSCYHDGYQEYSWPSSWNAHATASGPCGNVSPDGDGVPEQFWNCAEVTIMPDPSIQAHQDTTHIVATVPTNEPARPEVVATNPTPVVDMTSEIAIPIGLPSPHSDSDHVGQPPSSAGSHGKTIVGYYASWQWYDRQKLAAPINMDFTKVQRVNFAFFQTDTQGNMWGTDSWGDPNTLFGPYDWNPGEGSREYCSWDGPTTRSCNHHRFEEGLIHLVHAAGAEIYPSLGGWSLSDAFVAMAASPSARATFVQNCVGLIEEYGFDGIDIDWEYPGYEDHSGTPQDKGKFRLLLDEVRAALDELGARTGKFYGLTAALPCGPRHIANMDIAHVASTLSELNLMTYDFHGAFSETTGINAPLYPQGWGEEDFDVHSCVQNWIAGGGERNKINIGLPFYGRSFAGRSAIALNVPHSGSDKATWAVDDGTPQYYNIVAKLPSMTSIWDKTTWTPWAYFDNGGLVSYDDENAICAKVQYALENELGGFIIWELSGDLMEDLSTPLLDVTNKKLHNPDFDCGEPGFYPEVEEQVGPGIFSPGTSTQTSLEGGAVQSGPETSAVGAPVNTGQLANDQLVGDQPVVDQPVEIEPTNIQPVVGLPENSQPVNEQPANTLTVLPCGDQEAAVDDSKALELSFRYEIHVESDVSLSDALTEFKTSLLNGLAIRLGCTLPTIAKRGLRANLVEASRDYVLAIDSTQPDMPESDTKCFIAVNLDVPSTCHSVVGSVSARVKEESNPIALKEVADELLFFIRTSISAGVYESQSIHKVIYVENLSVNPLESNVASAYSTWSTDDNEKSNSLVIGFVCSLLIIVLVGVGLFAFVMRKRKKESRSSEETQNAESKPDDSEVSTTDVSTPEETWRKALDAEETWKKALDTFDDKIVADTEEQASEDQCCKEITRHPEEHKSTQQVSPVTKTQLEPDGWDHLHPIEEEKIEVEHILESNAIDEQNEEQRIQNCKMSQCDGGIRSAINALSPTRSENPPLDGIKDLSPKSDEFNDIENGATGQKKIGHGKARDNGDENISLNSADFDLD